MAGRGADDDESIEVHGGAEGIYLEARRGRHAGGRDLPQGGDQPSDLSQLEEAVWRAAAGRDASAEGTRRREKPPDKDRRGPDVGSGNAAGCHPAKARSPAGLNQWCLLAHPGRMRELVRGICIDWGA